MRGRQTPFRWQNADCHQDQLEAVQLHCPEEQWYRSHRSSQNKRDTGLEDSDAPSPCPTPIVNHRLTPTRQHLLNRRGAILAPKKPHASNSALLSTIYRHNTSIFEQDYEGGAANGRKFEPHMVGGS